MLLLGTLVLGPCLIHGVYCMFTLLCSCGFFVVLMFTSSTTLGIDDACLYSVNVIFFSFFFDMEGILLRAIIAFG